MKLDADNLPPDLRGEDINIEYLDMEYGIPEQISSNHDGSYTIFLNSRYSYERWVDSMEHAFNHVRDKDHEKDNVQEIEMHAHSLLPEVDEDPVPVPAASPVQDAVPVPDPEPEAPPLESRTQSALRDEIFRKLREKKHEEAIKAHKDYVRYVNRMIKRKRREGDMSIEYWAAHYWKE